MFFIQYYVLSSLYTIYSNNFLHHSIHLYSTNCQTLSLQEIISWNKSNHDHLESISIQQSILIILFKKKSQYQSFRSTFQKTTSNDLTNELATHSTSTSMKLTNSHIYKECFFLTQNYFFSLTSTQSLTSSMKSFSTKISSTTTSTTHLICKMHRDFIAI